MSNFILGAILGLLAGLAWCYYKQIQVAYRNRDAIGAASNLIDDLTALKDGLKL